MAITTKTRKDLKSYFVKNAIPTEGNFADLVDAQLNQSDDGVFKLAGEPLSVVAASGDQKRVLRLYSNYPAANPDWLISLNPTQKSGETSYRAGFGITDAPGNTRLFIDATTGNLGVGTNNPQAKLDVNGGARVVGDLEATGAAKLGSLRVTNALTPSAGNTETTGIMFPADPFGGSGDRAWIRYHNARGGEKCTLELGTANDPDDHILLNPSGNVGIGIADPQAKLDVTGNARVTGNVEATGNVKANRITGQNTVVLNNYQTVNPASNVFLYSPQSDRDAWIYLDSADAASNWGIYHRQIDSAVTGLPANSIGFVGGGTSKLQAYIGLQDGSASFAGNVALGGDVALGGKHAFRGSDTWLRLNQDGAFTSGVHTPGVFGPGALNVGGVNSYGNPGAGNAWFLGTITVKGAITPSAGNTDTTGIMFPADVFGGGGDKAWIRYHNARGGEKCTLEIGVANDPDDHILLNATGGVGIGTTEPTAKLDVNGDVAISGKHAFRGSDAWLRLNQDLVFANGVHTPGNFSSMALNVGGVSDWGNPGRGNAWFSGNVFAQGGLNFEGAVAHIDKDGALYRNTDGQCYLTVDDNFYIRDITSGVAAHFNTNNGSLSMRGSKNFRIDHPLDPERRYLVHSAIEGPEAAVVYRGEAQLVDGVCEVKLPHYFEALTRRHDRTVQLTPQLGDSGATSALAASPVADGRFIVRAIDNRNWSQRFYWEVKAVRADIAPIEVEPLKSDEAHSPKRR